MWLAKGLCSSSKVMVLTWYMYRYVCIMNSDGDCIMIWPSVITAFYYCIMILHNDFE